MPESKRRVPKNDGPTKPKPKVTKKSQNRERLGSQVAQLQGTILNLRQLYDQAVIEKQQLGGQIAQRDRLLTALAVEYGGSLETDEVMFNETVPNEWAGYEVVREDNLIIIQAVEKEEDEDASESDD